MTTASSPASEARRAAASPMFADLSGDIGVSFEFFPPKTEKMNETVGIDQDTQPAGPALCLGDLWRRRHDA